jgi:hypothetical protein
MIPALGEDVRGHTLYDPSDGLSRRAPSAIALAFLLLTPSVP